MAVIKEKSAGVIIFYHQGKSVNYLLLHHHGDYWNFPKGTQEKGENDLATALRELEEETGIVDVNIIDGFKEEINYDFDTKIEDGQKDKVYKKVVFFLGEAKNQKVNISKEHMDFGWFDFSTASNRLFYQDSQNLLKKVNQFLLSRQDFVL